MKNIEFDDKPLSFEIIIDEDAAVIYFSLHPTLNSQMTSVISGFEFEDSDERFRMTKFILPKDSGWGYGKVFKRSEKYCADDWVCWECSLPYKPFAQKIIEIALSMSYLVTAICINDNDSLPASQNQYLELNYLTRGKDISNGGAFSFAYSREVLDYNKYWVENEPKREDDILNCMRKIYTHLAGKRLSRNMESDFNIGLFHAESRFPTFRVPGNCACIGPSEYSSPRYPGARYVPHNIDSKIQQLSLLSGVIKLANMARLHYNQEITKQ
jgi:hypothetical protein